MAKIERLVILGLDGATWTVLDAMRGRGLMPNLDALLAKSAHGTLRSCVPPVTSAAWTTMMTGSTPGRHGVFDHRCYDAPSGRMKVNHSGRVRVPTFWQLLSEAGRTVVSINLPVTYPAPKVRGIIVSGMDAPHLEAALGGAPKEFADRLRSEIPGYHMRVLWKRPPESLEELTDLARQTRELFRARAQAGLLADRMAPDWSALMVQFQNLDPFQHRAWRHLNVDETGIDDPALNAAAGEVMRGLDDAIGILCELAEARGAGVLALSDHGFGPCLGRVQVNRILLDAGLIRVPGLAGKAARRLRQIPDRLRLWGEKRRDPNARHASFETSIQAQYPFDWKRTLAFAPHQDTAAMVYLNTGGHGAESPIKGPRQAEDALASVTQALSEAKHPETGAPLFPEMVPVAQRYGVDPAREGFPDLIALPDANYWVRSRFTSSPNWVDPDPALPGTHRPEGVVSLAGCGLEPGRNLAAQLVDIAPTILSLFGLPIPASVEGSPLPGVSSSVRRVDPPAAKVLNGPHSAPAAFEHSDAEAALIEQRLRELGYLD